MQVNLRFVHRLCTCRLTSTEHPFFEELLESAVTNPRCSTFTGRCCAVWIPLFSLRETIDPSVASFHSYFRMKSTWPSLPAKKVVPILERGKRCRSCRNSTSSGRADHLQPEQKKLGTRSSVTSDASWARFLLDNCEIKTCYRLASISTLSGARSISKKSVQ